MRLDAVRVTERGPDVERRLPIAAATAETKSDAPTRHMRLDPIR